MSDRKQNVSRRVIHFVPAPEVAVGCDKNRKVACGRTVTAYHWSQSYATVNCPRCLAKQETAGGAPSENEERSIDDQMRDYFAANRIGNFAKAAAHQRAYNAVQDSK